MKLIGVLCSTFLFFSLWHGAFSSPFPKYSETEKENLSSVNIPASNDKGILPTDKKADEILRPSSNYNNGFDTVGENQDSRMTIIPITDETKDVSKLAENSLLLQIALISGGRSVLTSETTIPEQKQPATRMSHPGSQCADGSTQIDQSQHLANLSLKDILSNITLLSLNSK